MKLRPFEIVLIAIFAIAALVGLFALSKYKSESDAESKPYGEKVVIWGTFAQSKFDEIIKSLRERDKGFDAVTYHEVTARSFESDLLNAIAEGSSPDLVILPNTMLVSFRSKLTAIPSETLDERTFKSTYIDGASIFMRPTGTYALPLAVDPLVLYWNRDLLASVGFAEPPKTWEMLAQESTPMLTKTDARRTVTQSAIGMGEFVNIAHAKEILSLLFFQAGTNIVEERDGRYTITLSATAPGVSPPARSALSFYTQFATPESSVYTWNRLLPLDTNAFTSGRLALYIGQGSEIGRIEEGNPNLNFDISSVPQAQGATALRNYGTFYGLAIPRGSQNVAGAYLAAQTLASAVNAQIFAQTFGLAPVHRSLYTGATQGLYEGVLREAGLIARGWLDPAPEETQNVFKAMVEDVLTGRKELDQVVSDAAYALETLFRF